MSVQPDDSLDVLGELSAAARVEELYDSGRRWIDLGFPIIPVNGKKPCNEKGHPARRWQKDECSPERLEHGLRGAFDPKRIAGKVPASEPGIGLRMGPGSCIDIEADSDDERAAIKHLFRGCCKPKTVSFESSRGRHDLYRYDERLAALGRDVFEYRAPGGKSVKIRVGGQKAGAQSVIPPRLDREWLPGCSFDEIEPAPLPEPVIRRLLAQARRRRKPAKIKTPAPKPGEAKPKAKNQNQTPVRSTAFRAVSVHVLRAPYESRFTEAVGAEVKAVFDSCVPTCFRKRHEAIFTLVRRLHEIPELQGITRTWLESDEGREWLSPLLHGWYVRGKRFFNADFDECWNDFVESWGQPKIPWGRTLRMFHEISKAEQLEANVVERLGCFDCESNHQLARFCAVLQRAKGNRPFPLDGRAAAKVMDWSQTRLSRKLRLFCRIGILRRTFEGARGRAAEYLYLPMIEGMAASVGAARDGLLAAAA